MANEIKRRDLKKAAEMQAHKKAAEAVIMAKQAAITAKSKAKEKKISRKQK